MSVLCELNKTKQFVKPSCRKLVNFSHPKKHQLPKEITQESLKHRKFSAKSSFFGTHPLTNNELKKLYQKNPA